MDNSIIRFDIPALAPSINHAMLVSRNGHRYPSPKLVAWQDVIRYTLKPQTIKQSRWYRMDYYFYYPIYNKSKPVPRKKDIDNLVKYTSDYTMRYISDGFGTLDDSRIGLMTATKVDSEKEHTVVVLSALDDNDPLFPLPERFVNPVKKKMGAPKGSRWKRKAWYTKIVEDNKKGSS